MAWLLEPDWLQYVVDTAKQNAIIFTIVGCAAGGATWWINRQVAKRTMARLALDERSSSDHHILNLCKALSDDRQSLQMAAAALLIDRAKSTAGDSRRKSERVAIFQALLAATMDDPRSTGKTLAPPDLCKYIADSVAEMQGAKFRKERPVSPLKELYWQQSRLTNADWKDVDARGLDLFGVNLDRASLRRARLNNSILYNASLKGTVLCGADMRDADLRGADFSGADFRDCTRTPLLVRTQLSGANLVGAKLQGTRLNGVDLRGARIDASSVAQAIFDQFTLWPTGFSPPQSEIADTSRAMTAS